VSARVIAQVCGQSKNIGVLRGQFASSVFDSVGRGSDGDFCPLLRQQTSGGETYPKGTASTGDERDSPGKVHYFNSFVILASTELIESATLAPSMRLEIKLPIIALIVQKESISECVVAKNNCAARSVENYAARMQRKRSR
jgi:hypothetical protein